MIVSNSRSFAQKLLFVIAIALLQNAESKTPKLPSYVKTCKYESENPSACYEDAVLHLKPYLAKGIPEMGLPPVEPLTIPQIRLNTGTGGSVSMDATLINASFHGGSDFKLRNINVHTKVETVADWYIEIFFPLIKMQSSYRAKGKVLLLQFDGDGDAVGEFGGVVLKGNFTATRVTRNGKVYYKMGGGKDTSVDTETIKLRLDGLFKDNQELNDNLNKVIEENIDVLAVDVKPVIAETIKSIFIQFIDQVYDKFPVNVLYPSE